jgi:hypothetical protein
MTAPTLIAGYTTAQRTGNGTTISISVPTYAAGDEVYLVYASDGDGDVATPQQGSGNAWTAQYDNVALTSGVGVVAVWHRTVSTEGTTYTIDNTVSERAVAASFVIRNYGGINATGTNSAGTTTTISSPAVTSTVNDCLRITIYGTNLNETSVGTFSGHTKGPESTYASAGTISVQYKALPSSGTDASSNITQSRTGAWLVVAFAIAPSGPSTQEIVPAFISSGATVYSPTVTPGAVDIAPNFIASTAVVYAPTVSHAGEEQSITPDYVASNATVYAPTITTTVNVAPDFIPSAATVHAPTITTTVNVSPDFIPSGAQVFAPTITTTVTITPDFIPSGAQVYAPTVTPGPVTVTVDFIPSTAVVYAPTVEIVGGSQSIAPDFIPSAAVVYSLTFIWPYAVAPANRTYVVEEEDRTYSVVEEDRTFAVDAEDRTYVVVAEDRTYEVDSEDRTYVVQGV